MNSKSLPDLPMLCSAHRHTGTALASLYVGVSFAQDSAILYLPLRLISFVRSVSRMFPVAFAVCARFAHYASVPGLPTMRVCQVCPLCECARSAHCASVPGLPTVLVCPVCPLCECARFAHYASVPGLPTVRVC